MAAGTAHATDHITISQAVSEEVLLLSTWKCQSTRSQTEKISLLSVKREEKGRIVKANKKESYIEAPLVSYKCNLPLSSSLPLSYIPLVWQ